MHPELSRDVQNLERLAEILDNKFIIPGTKVRFGLDGIIGLIPYIGDLITFLISGYLMFLIAKKGAGTRVIFKMLWYIWIDGLIGTIPFIGDIFDFRYRANLKNIELMKEFIQEGKHKGHAWGLLLFLIGLLLALIFLSIWIIKEILVWIVT